MPATGPADPLAEGQTVQRLIRQHVRRGSGVYTDGLNISEGLRALGYRLATVNHARHFVEKQGVRAQGIESHRAHPKPVLRARYRKRSPAHLPKYLAEADFKRNAAQAPDFIGFVLGQLLSHTL